MATRTATIRLGARPTLKRAERQSDAFGQVVNCLVRTPINVSERPRTAGRNRIGEELTSAVYSHDCSRGHRHHRVK